MIEEHLYHKIQTNFKALSVVMWSQGATATPGHPGPPRNSALCLTPAFCKLTAN